MGRKGMKGFLKGVHKQHGSDDEAAEEAKQPGMPVPQPAATKQEQPAPSPPQPPKPAPKAADRDEGSDEGSGDEEGGSKGPETRGQLLQRHKREMAAHKKAVQKLGSKKKDEAAKLTADLEARHARELRELEDRERHQQQQQQPQQPGGQQEGEQAGPSGSGEAAGAAAEQLAGMALGGGGGAAGGEHKKPSKAQKRREKLAQQEAEREQRIASEQASLGPSERAVEEERLAELLAPLRLGVREIRADGHCLYRAVEDQLAQHAAASAPAPAAPASVPDYLALRRLAASHIRSHPDDFVPFIFDEDAAGDPAQQLEDYCAELEGSAAWGGQLELGALAQALQRQIKVYACGMPVVTLGDEHAGRGGAVQLCYLRHAFGLGEHYNSTVPLGGGGAEAAAAAAAAANADADA